MDEVIKQHEWSEEELRNAGFRQFSRKKSIVMARRLPEEDAPLRIRTDSGDTLIAQAGYMICYEAGEQVRAVLSDYYHWPVEPQIFDETYRSWDEPFTPTPPIKHLMELGCKPYYKLSGVWAKELERPTYIQSLEHKAPVLVDKGEHLAIGTKGEPYHMSDRSFHNRYDADLAEPPTPIKRVLKRLVGFFKNYD